MEEKRGILSHFGTVIRIAILIILVAVLTFFVVRFFRNRQVSQRAQQTTHTAQTNQQGQKDQPQNTRQDSNNGSGNNSESSNQSTQGGQPIPRGIADGGSSNTTVPSAGPQSLPAAGSDISILLTSLLLSAATYLAVKNSNLLLQRSK